MKKILFILAAMVLGIIGLHAENTITYEATAKLPGHNGSLDVGATTFGSAITSHEFSNGTGTITCAGEITQIGNQAFYGCSDMTSITIPNSVTDIVGWGFGFCSELTSITIPHAVESIGELTFISCTKLTSVTIGGSLSVIRTCAFESCSSLNTIYCYAPNPPVLQGSTFRYIESNKISVYVSDVEVYKKEWGGHASFTFYSIPSKQIEVDGIKYEFFDGSKARVIAKEGGYSGAITIPEHIIYQGLKFAVTEIGDGAFTHSGITSINFPTSITKIGMGAFEYCGQLQSINLPPSLSVINKGTFQNTGLTSITIPDSVERIEAWAFQLCPNLKEVTIPSSSKLTFIGENAFNGSGLTSIDIPVSVKEIGAWAFKNCTSLKDLIFDERKDPINIGIYAFENMAVESVAIPKWMKEIPEGLFFNNTKLKVIYLHELIDSIGYRPFGACPFEYIISMSQTPPKLADGAFEGHDKDANVIVYVPTPDATFTYKNSKWGDYFANYISNITYKITTPTTVEVVHAIPANGAVNLLPVVELQRTNYTVVGIGNEALKGDTSLRSISLPATIQYIGNEAFCGCTKLKQTNSRAWEDLQTIGASAFYGCSALDSIVIPEAVQTIGKSAFMDCKNLTSISLPTGLKNIPDECFHKCPLGTEIIVPEGVETIGKYAFEGTEEARLKAKSIALPSTLKEINFAAFYLHDGLKTITCRALIPPTLTEQAFASKQFQAQQITVYVPNRDVVTAYKRSNWGDSILYNFKFSDLMAEENKAYLYEVAGDNEEAKAIAKAYCDSIDRATTTQQVQYYINTALTKIDKYTLNDYKIKLANYLDSVAGENLDAQRIAKEYRKKILLAIFRQEAEKIFAEGLAKINAVFELIDFKKACCDNLRNSAQNLGKEIIEIAEEYCILINQATTKEEANRIYLDGSQEISMYMQLSRYWEEPSNPGDCRTTYGYPKL